MPRIRFIVTRTPPPIKRRKMVIISGFDAYTFKCNALCNNIIHTGFRLTFVYYPAVTQYKLQSFYVHKYTS